MSKTVEHRTLKIEHRTEEVVSKLDVRCSIFDVLLSKIGLFENQRLLPSSATRLVKFVLLILAALAVCTSSALAADPPEIVVEAAAREIFTGESVDYLVEI